MKTKTKELRGPEEKKVSTTNQQQNQHNQPTTNHEKRNQTSSEEEDEDSPISQSDITKPKHNTRKTKNKKRSIRRAKK